MLLGSCSEFTASLQGPYPCLALKFIFAARLEGRAQGAAVMHIFDHPRVSGHPWTGHRLAAG